MKIGNVTIAIGTILLIYHAVLLMGYGSSAISDSVLRNAFLAGQLLVSIALVFIGFEIRASSR